MPQVSSSLLYLFLSSLLATMTSNDFRCGSPHYLFWVAVKEIPFSCHIMDIYKIIWFLDYSGNLFKFLNSNPDYFGTADSATSWAPPSRFYQEPPKRLVDGLTAGVVREGVFDVPEEHDPSTSPGGSKYPIFEVSGSKVQQKYMVFGTRILKCSVLGP